jgi:hypothetical protein
MTRVFTSFAAVTTAPRLRFAGDQDDVKKPESASQEPPKPADAAAPKDEAKEAPKAPPKPKFPSLPFSLPPGLSQAVNQVVGQAVAAGTKLAESLSDAVGEQAQKLVGAERYNKLRTMLEVSRQTGVPLNANVYGRLSQQLQDALKNPQSIINLDTYDQLLASVEKDLQTAVDQKHGAGHYAKTAADIAATRQKK